LEGIINVLKPPGMTSHDVIYWIRKNINIKKAGHTGTLDPGAAGVLPVCIGKATKIIPYINENKKVYRAKIVFGEITDTQDKYGQVLKKSNPDFTISQLYKAFNAFTGKIKQKPSIYSAIKVKGKRLYDYARQGQGDLVDIPIREVYIYNIKLIYHKIPEYAFIEVECSKGTYIRTLCSDIGDFLGCGAHMGFLLRTSTGDFNLKTSITLEEIEIKNKKNHIEDILLPLDYSLNPYPKIYIKESAKKSLINGNSIYPQGIITDLKKFNTDSIVTTYINNKLSAIGKIQYDNDNDRYYFKSLRVLL
jgi:tRNA pseudouridine55 synthase